MSSMHDCDVWDGPICVVADEELSLWELVAIHAEASTEEEAKWSPPKAMLLVLLNETLAVHFVSWEEPGAIDCPVLLSEDILWK